jgi:hypothetical protein
MKYYITIMLALALLLFSCRKADIFTSDHGAVLTFNKTTVQFDTVFTQMGSATLNFKVKNTNKNGVRSNISLAKGKNSNFRINVDGKPGISFPAKELAGGDSMYVFVEVTIDPQNQNNPFIVSDSIIFQTNGNTQYVSLVAWGQVADYRAYGYHDSLTGTMDNTIPHVILNYAFVPKGETLIISPGTRIYCHAGAVIDVFGTLIIQGTKNDPVIIQGDRLERDPVYSKGPGQWQGIVFRPGSKDNSIIHAIIQNGDFGIYDSLYPPLDNSSAVKAKLRISKTIIRNMTAFGILGLNTWIDMDNSLIYNIGRQAFFAYGGVYNVAQCTIDNSSNSVFQRQSASVFFTDQRLRLQDNTSKQVKLKSLFYNTIIWGTQDDEADFVLSNANDTLFRKCDIKAKIYSFGVANFNTDPAFSNLTNDDYHFNGNSPLKGNAWSNFSLLPATMDLTTDIEENKWSSRQPGCYQGY